MRIGIVGHGADKFTEETKAKAIALIRSLLSSQKGAVLVSGHSPVGGIDIWAEDVARDLGIPVDIKNPRQRQWDAKYGFKQRNIDIALSSDEVHVIIVDKYPPSYKGRRFGICYHCNSTGHVKSGGCWTGKYARKLKKRVEWHIIRTPS